MSSRTTIAGLVALLSLGALSTAHQIQGAGEQSPADRTQVGTPKNPINCEPILVYDQSGLTHRGKTHRHLALYSNGSASLTEKIPGREPRIETLTLLDGMGQMLYYQLLGHGCMQMKDQVEHVMDVPLSSVTLFQGATDAQAHTFNYWLPQGPFEDVDKSINDFIDQHFPVGR